MIKFSNSNIDITQIADEWGEMVDTFLSKGDRILKMINNVIHYKYTTNNGSEQIGLTPEDVKLGVNLLIYYKANLNYFLLARQDELLAISDFYKKWITGGSKQLHKCMQIIFTKAYEDFRKTDPKSLVKSSNLNEPKVAYYFFRKLNIKTCPYCNRQYTYTIYSSKLSTSPEYDHFYDKSEIPILALSFYNLVPSCHTCNHIKGTAKLSVNPYFEEVKGRFIIVCSQDDAAVTDPLLLKDREWKIKWKSDEYYKHDNIKNLGLDLLYAEHTDYVEEILSKVQDYSSCAKEVLVNAFQCDGRSVRDVDNFVWGPYIDVTKHSERPLSKLTHDLLEQFKIIPK